ncbi:MAG TPA: putative DNA modification/repair radical SAM protein [Bacillota bacterium]|nr:putative DNA modification/repair radical SAM protein [Bacillota bacterium]HOL10678.1 putative DNA modification/repair radical SAM protein [Bacillota bacterium]HPO98363.1 putative DNA modification/repair radical SAM protein [Bacillota bacterium]
MDVLEKVKILAGAAKYDVACASSGSNRTNDSKGQGNSASSPLGICHSWSADGRCISLLKILYSNYCIYDCAYCINRRSNDIPRAALTVDELTDLTLSFYRRNYIEGLFLSSGIIKSPDYTMELLLKVIRKLRTENNFNGYIHLKVIPGASPELIHQAGLFADRLSVNIELPSEQGLQRLAPDKKREAILTPMAYITTAIEANAEERKLFRKATPFVPAGQSTQLVVGASPDTDFQILRLSEELYRRVKLKRVYYSAYIPVNHDQKLPVEPVPPMKREHRLYQADWLIRFYKFQAQEIVNEQFPTLETELDPKTSWALRNLHLFPVEVNRADLETLLRIPGVGLQSAKRIVAARRFTKLTFENLVKMGVVIKRARYFITCGGKKAETGVNEADIRRQLTVAGNRSKVQQLQLTLFDQI